MNKIYPIVSHKGFVSAQNVEIESIIVPLPQLWMQQQPATAEVQPSVNPNQWTSLSAMIVYIADKSGQSEFRIERNLSDRFNIPNAKCLSTNDYDNAIRYLADILPA